MNRPKNEISNNIYLEFIVELHLLSKTKSTLLYISVMVTLQSETCTPGLGPAELSLLQAGGASLAWGEPHRYPA